MSAIEEVPGPRHGGAAVDGDRLSDVLVQAALRAAETAGCDVAGVPLVAIAREAGISRSTLIRHFGGKRRPLDEAVRAAGVDPGRRRSVRERAVEAAGELISECGLAALTLELIAARAQCSTYSLYAAFGGRDSLIEAVFERYSPILDIDGLLADPDAGLEDTVRRFHQLLAAALTREPRVAPAMFASVLAAPTDPAVQILVRHLYSRILGGLGAWLAAQIATGCTRDLPIPLLLQQMVFPVMLHFLTRSAHPDAAAVSPEQTCEFFTQCFLNAVTLPDA